MGFMLDVSNKSISRSYGGLAIALIAVAASLLTRYAIVQYLGIELPPFITLYPAVMIVAILAGLWPGLLATALAALGTDYLVLSPRGQFAIAKTSDIVALAFFSAMGILMSLLAEHYRRSQRLIATYQEEKAVRQREELYRGLFSSMEEGFCIIEMIFDLEGKPADYRFLEVNAAFENQTGLHEAVGKRMRELAPSHEAHWFETYGKIALTGESAHFLNEAKALDRFYEVRAYRVGEPELRHVAIVFSDISERMRVEKHLQHLNRVYTVLSDINQTIVREKDSQAMLDAACRIAVEKGQFRMAWIGMIDPNTQELQPIASDGLVDGYLNRLRIDCLDPKTATGPAARCFHTGEHAICNDIEHELFRPWRGDAIRNGYRSMAAFPLRCEGKIIGIFCLYANELASFDSDETQLLGEMAMDISYALEVNRHEKERQKSEEELRWRTAFFEAQVDSAPDGVLVVDGRGKKILQNQRLNELLKIPKEISEDANDALQFEFVSSLMRHPDQFDQKVRYLNSHTEEVSRDEIELLDGTIFDRYSSPVKDKALNYYGRIWTFRDITERRQLEEQFRQAQKMEAIGQLTGGIAHDFNNLLTVILGCSESIGDEVKENPRLSKMTEMISNAARRGADLTHRMLAFARRQALEPRSVDVNQLLVNIEDFLRRTLSADIELNVIQAREGCEATADPTELESALLNLCVNARDAMPRGGRLTIEASNAVLDVEYADRNPGVKSGQYVLLAVSDTGVGINAANLHRVFDPFFTTKEVGKGTGLGLSMVYGFAKQSQGHVKIYSELGHGTSVKLFLPMADQPSEPLNQNPSVTIDLHGSELILLVEDDASVRGFAKSELMSFGYRVLEANNGKDALQILQLHKDIDLLFTDVIMPGGLNGRELALEALRLNPILKVMYCSGYAENAILQQSLLSRDVPLLSKPYCRLELARKIREVLLEDISVAR